MTPDPPPCHACPEPAVYTVWFAASGGLQWPERLCRRDSSLRADQVRAEGGQVVRVEAIAPAPAARYQQT